MWPIVPPSALIERPQQQRAARTRRRHGVVPKRSIQNLSFTSRVLSAVCVAVGVLVVGGWLISTDSYQRQIDRDEPDSPGFSHVVEPSLITAIVIPALAVCGWLLSCCRWSAEPEVRVGALAIYVLPVVGIVSSYFMVCHIQNVSMFGGDWDDVPGHIFWPIILGFGYSFVQCVAAACLAMCWGKAGKRSGRRAA